MDEFPNLLVHNILFSCTETDELSRDDFVSKHYLSYGISGTLHVQTPTGGLVFPSGRISFVRKGQLLRVKKIPDTNGLPFRSISIGLDESLLVELARELSPLSVPTSNSESFVDFGPEPFLVGYFQSLLPYATRPSDLSDSLATLKTREAIQLLLKISPGLSNTLFNFQPAHQIDLEEFMHRHFTFRASLDEFASMTGRSLSTFRRDFKETFNETPEKWLNQTRLDQSYYLISAGKLRPTEAAHAVGFANISHFSTAFSKKFGVAPSHLYSGKQK